MFVREINIREFRHLKDISLGPFAEPAAMSDAIVLAGANGGGKSSVLELLGYALSQSWSLGWGLARNFPTASFEVSLGLSDEEVSFVETYVHNIDAGGVTDYLPHLRQERTLYRAFNYENGKYSENPHLQNRLYSAASQGFRETGRSFGLFLKADRNYPVKNFQRERIFEFESMRTADHAMHYAFNTSESQYDDLYNYLAQQRYHHFAELGAFHFRKGGAPDPGGVAPADPLAPYEDLLGRLFPGYTFEQPGGEIPTDLLIRLPSGQVLPFRDLSSGEKEVFFLLSSFLRHGVRDSVICVDEPELHLHPELSRILVQEMRKVAPRCQFWLATHNAEILDEVGRDRVLYLSKAEGSGEVQVTSGSDEQSAMLALRTLFGVSGYIGVAKTMIFLEGEESSVDRKALTRLFPDASGRLKFIPSGGVDSQVRINDAVLALLESTFGIMKFYLLRDRDYLTDEMVAAYRAKNHSRIHVLDRCHIENYLLDFDVIAEVMRKTYDRAESSEYWAGRFAVVAKKMAAGVLRDMASFRMNFMVPPQDFSMGKFLAGQALTDPSGVLREEVRSQFEVALNSKASQVSNNLIEGLSSVSVSDLVTKWSDEVVGALQSGSWVQLFPGKRLVNDFAKQESIGPAVAFTNNVLRTMSDLDRRPQELVNLIELASAGAAWP